jgi:NAD(P)H-hydrate epimerase
MMKILLSEQVRATDAYTIENEPIASIDLMERAAKTCTDYLIRKFKRNTKFYVFAGPGNNGGDGLVIARLLTEKSYLVETYLISKKFSKDSATNYERLQKLEESKVAIVNEINELPEIENDAIIIDALFGSGLTRPLGGFAGEVVKFINKTNTERISIDIPSGLFAEDNSKNVSTQSGNSQKQEIEYETVIKANCTLTLEMPFLSFFFPENVKYVGKVYILPIGLHKGFIESLDCDYYYVKKESIEGKIRKREKFAHKGNFGHALLISGSYGKMGAAVLSSKACIRTGVGLLTCHIPKCGYNIMQISSPETMISIDSSEEVFSQTPDIEKYNAIGIGPGLDKKPESIRALKDLLIKTKSPMVFDADALNLLAENADLMKLVPENSIFTPHPKEFERLAGKSDNHYQRNKLQIEFAKKHKLIVILKGANTAIVTPEGKCYFNSSGNPGMATAGSGDVLTGIILSLIAQKNAPLNAAITGVYLHGLAGDIAAEKYGEETMIAGDIIDSLSTAFKQLR